MSEKEDVLKLMHKLKNRTDATMLNCRFALEETNMDIEEAEKWLKKNDLLPHKRSMTR